MTVTYSLQLVRDLGSDLHTVADVMDGRNTAAQYEPRDVGSEVAGALDHFSGSWDDKREQLTRGMRSVGDMAQGTADVFEGFDQDMAAKVEQIMEGA